MKGGVAETKLKWKEGKTATHKDAIFLR